MNDPQPPSRDADTSAGALLERLVAIMARLRDPATGCAWDRAQSFATIAPYTIEEAYEVADAIARDDMAALADELGDLLLQVVFHAAIAADRGAFDIRAVIAAINDKMTRRHPHIFGTADPAGRHDWEALKAAERADAADPSALAGVALALPALMRAEKIQKRAARTGFDWPDPAGARAKLIEEIAELDSAPDADARREEYGDVLFSAVNWGRLLGLDPEQALRAATAKFERRFRAMEAADPAFAALSLTAQDALWRHVKEREQTG